jgi:hypothetical protein
MLRLKDMTSFREIVALTAFVSSLAACGPGANVPPTLGRTEPPPRAERTGPLVTVDGEMMGVDRASPGDKLATGVRISIGTDRRDPLQIQLAPGWYLDERGLKLAEREQIHVLGMPIRTGSTTRSGMGGPKGRRDVPVTGRARQTALGAEGALSATIGCRVRSNTVSGLSD